MLITIYYKVVQTYNNKHFYKKITKMNIDKQEALKRLGSLEEEAKKLREIIEKSPDSRPIIERIKTIADACAVLNIKTHGDAYKVLALKRRNGNLRTANANLDITECEDPVLLLQIITRALNEDWYPDWYNGNQAKYYPWFEFNKTKAGFGFSNTYYDYTHTYTFVGSRLCFKTRELAEYAGRQFENIYTEHLNP